MPPLITQSNNSAAGDIAAGDIVKTTIQLPPSSALRDMADKFRMECSEDAHLSCFIERLQHYLDEAPKVPSRDLSEKLRAGNRSDLELEALQLKERFSKKLARLQFSEQAQEIFAHVLSKIHAFFSLRVRPKLLHGASRYEIDQLIYEELLVPIHNEIAGCNLIDLVDLQGMMYFLAGNCHISWD